ncbi:hypothetical protein [Anoxybacillus flavithermus]|uniref:hypothetical protein n=1 Tax=Anoxybacillus flavithermus TaxID=33934 RepID=UPI0018695292|nr:hypothetical protein [Anoxybacillus flavithermus]MBE2927395.1 hypothetical protein [Anoxybacillus flavithermus]MBE2946121.1 hypothetical protein [Anoxybacillus flavithermus]MBE2948889.1 hypothetical protein [Anoxybacillus flavithermus]
MTSRAKKKVSDTNRSTQSKKKNWESKKKNWETVSYIKHISSSVQLQTQAKKENRETVSYIKHVQTLVYRHRREFVSVNSFILPVHFETVIRRKQTLTKNEDRNISVFVEPIHTNIYQTNQTKKENISCQTKKEIMKIYANAHHEENLSNTYAIENPSYVEVI